MNKKRILRLFGTISPAVALCATGSIFLTSCSNNPNEQVNFTDGLTKTLNVRNLVTEQTPYPVYATPTQQKELMVPNFKLVNELNGNPLEDDPEIDPNTGWPTLASLEEMNYNQVFMNDDVAREVSNGKPYTPFVLKDMAKNLSTKGKLNLKGLYKYDEYADESIKVFNCPYFYDAVDIGSGTNDTSVYSGIKTIDLSENNLWYLPFFGYNANPDDEYYFIMREETDTEKGFVNLGVDVTPGETIIDLRDNQITLLPFADDFEGENYDLTNLFSYGEENAIAIDGNCIGYDLLNASSLTNYRTYNYMGAIAFHTDPSTGFGYQSYAVFTNREQMYDEVVSKCASTLNESKEDFTKRSLDSYVNEIQQLSKVMKESEVKYHLWDCLNQLIAEYLSDNGLVSAYIYTKYEIELTLLVQLFSNSDFIYNYPSYSSNNGCINFSFQLGTPRICEKENNKYVNKYATGQGSYFVAFSVFGFDATHVMPIIIGSICAIVGLALIFVIIYYAWLRKVIAKKRQLKDLEAIDAAKRENEKGDKNA